jgi:hypothetical protein
MSSEDTTGRAPSPAEASQQPQIAPVPPRSRAIRPRWWIAAGVAGLLALTAAIIVVVTGGSGQSSAVGQFDKAYQAFHTRFATQSAALTDDLGRAQGHRIGDPAFAAATTDAKALATSYQQYASSIAAITMPTAAKAGAARLIQVANTGQFLMNQAADFFTASGMQSVLDTNWPQVKDELTKAEDTVRTALGLTT